MKTILLNGIVYLFISFLFSTTYFIYQDVADAVDEAFFIDEVLVGNTHMRLIENYYLFDNFKENGRHAHH